MTYFDQFKTPVVVGVNDLILRPTNQLGGNASDLIAKRNNLLSKLNTFKGRIDALKPKPSLFMSFDGPEGSTDFASSSTGGHTYERYGASIKITTTEGRSGGSCLRLDAFDELHIIQNPNNSLNLADDDFTIEFWLKLNQPLYAGYFMRFKRSSDMLDGATLSEYPNGFYITGYGQGPLVAGKFFDVAPAWNHHAITRKGTVLRSFMNGQQIASITTKIPMDASGPIVIGGGVNGYLDDLSITTKFCKYTGNFVVS